MTKSILYHAAIINSIVDYLKECVDTLSNDINTEHISPLMYHRLKLIEHHSMSIFNVLKIKDDELTSDHVTIGQEAITPNGLGRVIDYKFGYPDKYIQVRMYHDNVAANWDPINVELINPRR